MIQKRLILTNAIFSVAQVLVIGGTLFFLYRFLIGTIGIERVGIWSLVLATTSVANIANLGLSGSIVKFVARYNAQNDHKTVSDAIQTASVSIAVVIALILVIAYPFADWVLSLVVPSTK
jgi:O-antigen/teichoic acid export membrane protein